MIYPQPEDQLAAFEQDIAAIKSDVNNAMFVEIFEQENVNYKHVVLDAVMPKVGFLGGAKNKSWVFLILSIQLL